MQALSMGARDVCDGGVERVHQPAQQQMLNMRQFHPLVTLEHPRKNCPCSQYM